MDKMLGVYIHIPFCASKCGYCDFCSVAGQDGLMPKYQSALMSHIESSAPQLAGYYIDSLYFGGGTPSYYGAKRICELLGAVKRAGQLLKSAEITVEMNPDSTKKHDLALLRKEGVNRISLGVQSCNDDILKLIGRRHSFKQAEQAMKAAREAGFDNVSIDLIFGLPSQTKNDWADTLTRALSLRPEHISCYGLKLEEGTDMYVYKDSPFLADDDEQADMYLYTVETLERYGYTQYEISNFSLEGYASRHNQKYWALRDYMGFGCASHSCLGGVRYSYVSSIPAYIAGVNGEGELLDEYEKLGPLDRACEYIMLGMRTTRGISRREYLGIYRSGFDAIEEALKEFRKKGWAVQEGDRWHFTSSGFLLSNTLICMLLEAQAEQKLSANPWVRDTFEGMEEKLELPVRNKLYTK